MARYARVVHALPLGPNPQERVADIEGASVIAVAHR
jgi:hypothetical protein